MDENVYKLEIDGEELSSTAEKANIIKVDKTITIGFLGPIMTLLLEGFLDSSR